MPKVKIERKGVILSSMRVNEPLSLKNSSIVATSEIFDIGEINTSSGYIQQQAEIRSANKILLNNFIEVNHNLLDEYDETDLRKHDQLFNRWFCLDWFKVGGLEECVLIVRLKLLWLELFSGFFEYLASHDVLADKKKGIFLDLMNKQFKAYIDENIYEGESGTGAKERILDLESIPERSNFWSFSDRFIKDIEKMYL